VINDSDVSDSSEWKHRARAIDESSQCFTQAKKITNWVNPIGQGHAKKQAFLRLQQICCVKENVSSRSGVKQKTHFPF